MIALLISLPLLTVLADVLGIFGGWATATGLYAIPSSLFISSVRDGISTDDIIGGVVKPIVFSLIIGSIACRQGLSTEGGTVGVGRSTTRAVVMASIIVIIADYFLAKALQVILGTT
jgi:phospholipid/cholesterol/gamma-HCH transport system permease protein